MEYKKVRFILQEPSVLMLKSVQSMQSKAVIDWLNTQEF